MLNDTKELDRTMTDRRGGIISGLSLIGMVFSASLLFFACSGTETEDGAALRAGSDEGTGASEPDAEERSATGAGVETPGVREVAPGRYEVVVYAFQAGYDPLEIRVPAGAEITFRVRARDEVNHGFLIEGTTVELNVSPFEFEEATYTFAEEGEYFFLCYIYCGAGHDVMRGKVIAE